MTTTPLQHGVALLALALGLSTLGGCAKPDASLSADAAVPPSASASSAPASTSPVSIPRPPAPPPPAPSAAPSPSAPGPAESDAGVTITVLREGSGAACEAGDRIMIHYTATLLDGSLIASSYEKRKPLEMTIGERKTVRGLSQGVTGMRRGEKRRLVVPPELAFGAMSNAKIPPNSTIVYEVELLAIKDK